MYTVFNGQALQWAIVNEEQEVIKVKLHGLEKPIEIKGSDGMYQHYKAEYEMLKEELVSQRQQKALGIANRPKVVKD